MRKNKTMLWGYILALFFGVFGAHRYYYQKYKSGSLYLLFFWTGIPVVLGWVDMFFVKKWTRQINEGILVKHKQRVQMKNKKESITMQTNEELQDKHKQRGHGNKREQIIRQIDMDEIDLLSGFQFEIYLKEIYESIGYIGVVTPKTGDYGADLILYGNEKQKIVVQAKRYSSNKVGVAAVREIYTSKAYYSADQAWVVTNSYFTNQAIILGNKIGVRLVDRGGLDSLLNHGTVIEANIRGQEKVSRLNTRISSKHSFPKTASSFKKVSRNYRKSKRTLKKFYRLFK